MALKQKPRQTRLGQARPGGAVLGQQAGGVHARGVAPLRYAAGSSRGASVGAVPGFLYES